MLEHTIREVKVFLFFFPEMRLYFLIFISAVCFLFLLLRYVQLFFTNSNQSRSEFIPTPNFYFICQCLLYLFVGIWYSLVSVYLCLRVDDTAASFSRRGLGAYVPYFPRNSFAFSYPAVSYFASLEVCFSSQRVLLLRTVL